MEGWGGAMEGWGGPEVGVIGVPMGGGEGAASGGEGEWGGAMWGKGCLETPKNIKKYISPLFWGGADEGGERGAVGGEGRHRGWARTMGGWGGGEEGLPLTHFEIVYII